MAENKKRGRPSSGEDLTGRTFDRWTVLSHVTVNRRTMWQCRCNCGTTRPVNTGALLRRTSRSCGCLTRETTIRRFTKHGCKPNSNKSVGIYTQWSAMKQRCYYPKYHHFHRYGGRGIKVCDRWHDFKNFLEDMGPTWQKGLSLERLNRDRDYEPANCIWATQQTQCNNTCVNRVLSFNGDTMTVAQWARKLGVKPYIIRDKLKRGSTSEEILSPLLCL